MTGSNHELAVAENAVNREFERDQPNEVWVSDLTYIPTKSGWLYPVAIIDLYLHNVVGWSTDIFLSAFEMALGRRGDVLELTHHSDRGSQYCSHASRSALRRNEIECSMSRKGNCWEADERLTRKQGCGAGELLRDVPEGIDSSARICRSGGSSCPHLRIHRGVL